MKYLEDAATLQEKHREELQLCWFDGTFAIWEQCVTLVGDTSGMTFLCVCTSVTPNRKLSLV